MGQFLPSKFFRVQCRALDSVKSAFACRGQQRRGLGEELVVVRLHPDGLDEHRVAGVLIRMQLIGVSEIGVGKN